MLERSSNSAEPRNEEVIAETPHGVKYRVDYTRDSGRANWDLDGYFGDEEAAREQHESNERMGYFSRIVKVVD